METVSAIPIASGDEFERWLVEHGRSELEVVVAIFKKASGKQTVTLGDLQEASICHGWIDTQSKGIDEERYAIRFVPRRPRSNWSALNRSIARRLLAEGRMKPEGIATLPEDL